MFFGNSSMHDHVELVDVEFPPDFVARFPGPRFGMQGIRELLGAGTRPLTCAALKPQGLAPERLAALCYTLTLADTLVGGQVTTPVSITGISFNSNTTASTSDDFLLASGFTPSEVISIGVAPATAGIAKSAHVGEGYAITNLGGPTLRKR